MGGDLGEHAGELSLATQPPAVILMAGLQGAGKTTTTGKAGALAVRGAARPGRPQDGQEEGAGGQRRRVTPGRHRAAEDRGRPGRVDFLPSDVSQKPEDIARNAIDHARRHHYDVLIVDTAGRLGIDEAMMREIRALHDLVKPIETLFVVDAMQGQDAVNTARAFGDALPLTGVVLTKLDGDARRRRGAVGAPRHRQAAEVRRRLRKAGRPRAVPP